MGAGRCVLTSGVKYRGKYHVMDIAREYKIRTDAAMRYVLKKDDDRIWELNLRISVACSS